VNHQMRQLYAVRPCVEGIPGFLSYVVERTNKLRSANRLKLSMNKGLEEEGMVRLRMEAQVPCHWPISRHSQLIGRWLGALRHEFWFVGGAWWGFSHPIQIVMYLRTLVMVLQPNVRRDGASDIKQSIFGL
jgi:hypothetical protein